jgi:hypothetical protein
MKISTFHKNLGNAVELIKGEGKPVEINYKDYDKGYASIIFTKHKDLVKDFPWYIGGTGIDINKQLPYNVEHLMPDYSLYPDNKYSIGFTTRGCIRNCGFCFVPKKEGLLKYNCDIDEFYNPKLKKIMLLDNNILAYNDYDKVFDQIRKINKLTCFKQGMDFRLLNDDKVEQLKSIKYDGNYIFAYDSMSIRSIIERQMTKYKKYFPDWSLKFFVLVGFDTTLKEDIFRAKYLVENKCIPYIMRFEYCYNSEYKNFYTDFAAYYNQVWAFKKLTFKEFLNKRYKNQKRIDYSLNLWDSNYVSNI